MKQKSINIKKSVDYFVAPQLALMLFVALFMTLINETPSYAQVGKVKANYGAWQLKCGRAPGAKNEKCALVQSVAAEDRPNVGLTVIFLKSVDGTKKLLRVIAPLGVLLPTGLGLKIDNADIGHTKFLKCGKIGCIAEVAVTDDLMGKFEKGSTAVFIIFQTPEAGIGIPIQLQGFHQGLAGLQ